MKKLLLSTTLSLIVLIGLLVVPVTTFAASDIGFFERILYTIVVNVLGLFVGLAGQLLDFAINTFVIGFGEEYARNGIGVAVDTTWVVIRDFINMSFIFGLVYIGMKMILDSDTSSTRRWLVNLIIAALLVNFSLFFTKFVIDVSNQFATAIAEQGFQPKTVGEGIDVSAALMDKLGVVTVLDRSGDAGPPVTGYGYIFGTALILIIAIFVFAAGAILLTIRFVMLNLFLVFSPVMFLSYILPPLQSISRDYWRKFLGKAFFAPIYLLFLYISFTILDAMGKTNAIQKNDLAASLTPGSTAALLNNADNDNSFAFFIFAAILLIGSLIVSNKLGADGASKAMSLGKDLSNRAQRKTTDFAKGTARVAVAPVKYGAAMGARGLSNKLGGELDTALRRAQQDTRSGIRGKLNRAVTRSNFVQDNIGGLADTMQNKKFGLKRTVDEEARMRNQTETKSKDAISIREGVAAQKDREAEEERRISMGAAEGTVEIKRNGITTFANHDDLTNEEKEARKEQDKKIAEMQRLAAEMNIKQFEAMTDEEQESIAQFMSGPLTESVMKSDKISDKQKEAIGKAQEAAIRKSITSGNEIIAEKLNALSIRQIETLGDEFITENAALFNDSLFSDIKKSKKFSEGQVGRFVGKRKSDLKKMVSDPQTAAKVFTQTYRNPDYGNIETKARKAAEIARLPGNVLSDANSVQYLNIDVLKAIASSDKEFERVSTDDREKIAELIRFENDRYLGNNPQFKKAADYLKSVKGQRDFIGFEQPAA